VQEVDTLIVGAGQAGLALSYHLRLAGHEHVLLERGRVAQRWHSQRWDTLRFQSPNWSLVLPGAAYRGSDPEGFAHKDQVLGFLLGYAEGIQAPVIVGSAVRALRRAGPCDPFEISCVNRRAMSFGSSPMRFGASSRACA
jgi:putative flavoprotein involved in K+ transport